MIGQWAGAVARAFAVVLFIATPSLILPSVASDAAQIVALVAIFTGALTLFEYSATYPGIVEFRDAPPFNRVRFLSMFVTVALLSLICRGQTEPTTLTEFVRAIGYLIGHVLDFPYSPVRLIVMMLPEGADPAHLLLVRMAAGMAYLISIMALAILWIVIRINRWPVRSGSFNVWVNLPTFDPTAGGDVVARLTRDARFNVALGFLMPFLFPALVTAYSIFFEPVTLENHQTLIWTVSAWALLPASLFMRGIALQRIVQLIREQRRRADLEGQEQEPALQPA